MSHLNQHVLVLNRLWQAVNICTAKRALTLLFEGRAQVVMDGADGSFQTFDFNAWQDFSEREIDFTRWIHRVVAALPISIAHERFDLGLPMHEVVRRQTR